MAFNYKSLVTDVANLIKDMGKTATLVDQTGTSQGKVGCWEMEAEQVDSKISGSIPDNKKTLMIGVTKNVPQMGWLITVDKVSYYVIAVEPVQPGSTVIYYELQVST